MSATVSTSVVFRDWAKASGFNERQLAKAAASIGLTQMQGRSRSQGRIEMPEIELLGLTAAFLGLPPWESGFAELLDDDARAILGVAKREIARCIRQREGIPPNTSTNSAA